METTESRDLNQDLGQMSEAEVEQVAAQLRRPGGEHADAVARLMHQGNAQLILQTYDLLAPCEGGSLLEVGPGSGGHLGHLLTAVGPQGRITTVDYSAEMVALTRANQAGAVADGRLAVHEGSLQALPFEAGSFDGLCTINTLYFWDEPARCLAECRRVLKHGGRLALGFRSRACVGHLPFTRHGFTLYSPAEACALLEAADFEILALQRSWHDGLDGVSLLARRS